MNTLAAFLGKIIIFFLVFSLLFDYLQEKELIIAEEKVAETSAEIYQKNVIKDNRVEKLRRYLQFYNSPLAPHAYYIVQVADDYHLDWKLIPAIAGVESTFGLYTPYNSFNAYGWNNGKHAFKDWQEGINYVSHKLKENYINRGAKNVDQIGAIYAESPAWAKKVKNYMLAIENFRFPLQFSP